MIDVQAHLAVPYVDGGRTMQGYDCWGQLLLLRQQLGCGRLPSLGGVTRSTPLAMCNRYADVSGTLEACEPEVGAIAAVFKGRAFVHCGVVLEIDGRLAVIETNPGSGPRWLHVQRFLEQYARVIFYRDRNIPE